MKNHFQASRSSFLLPSFPCPFTSFNFSRIHFHRDEKEKEKNKNRVPKEKLKGWKKRSNVSTMSIIGHLLLCLYILFTTCAIDQVESVKCFQCEFNRNECPVLGGCPQNRDKCSVGKMNPWNTARIECPDGCSTFLVTDPVGDVITWKRGCSNQPPTGPTASNICTTEYILGSYRVDSCVCNRFLCNSVPLTKSCTLSIIGTAFVLLVTLFKCLLNHH